MRERQRFAVLRVLQSPLNPRQWCLELECGHDSWVMSASRPRRRFDHCYRCEEKKRRAAIAASEARSPA